MRSLIEEHNSNYSKTTGSLWFYSKEKEINLMQILQALRNLRQKLLGKTTTQPAPNVADGIL